MVARVAQVVVVERRRALREAAIVRVPRLKKILPDQHAAFIGQIVEFAIAEMAVQPDHVHIHAQHQLHVALIPGAVHLRHVDLVVVVRAAYEHAFAVQVKVPADLLDLANAHGQALPVHGFAGAIEQPHVERIEIGRAVIPGPPQPRLVHGERELRRPAVRRRADLITLVRCEVAWCQRQFPGVSGLVLASGQLGLQVHVDRRARASQTRIDGDIANHRTGARDHAHRARDAERCDVVRFLVHRAVRALDRVRTVPPVVADGRPHAHQNLVVAARARLPGDVVLVRVDVALVPSDADAIDVDVGVVIGGVELQPQPLPSKALGHAETPPVPPLFTADPLGRMRVDLLRLQPLRVGRAGYLYGAPARRGRSRAFLGEGQLPRAVQAQRVEAKGSRRRMAHLDVWLACGRGHDVGMIRTGRLRHLHQHGLSEHAIFPARFDWRVGCGPNRECDRDLAFAAGLLRDEAARARPAPAQVSVEGGDAERAVILRALVVHHVAAG